MQTYNIALYHCLRCGNLLRREMDSEHPKCCGQEMVHAAMDKVRGAEDVTFQVRARRPAVSRLARAKPPF